MTLHIVSKSPGGSSALADCADSFAPGDTLLLIEDGVYALTGSLPDTIPAQAVHYLKADASARGLTVMRYQGIDDARWVTLCCQQNPVVSWFN